MREGVCDCIEVLRAIGAPVVLVPGNNESLEELRAACRGWRSATVLHGNGADVAGQPFFGIGGGIPVTPFGDWSYDFTEQQAARMLGNCERALVLVSHSPPKGFLDDRGGGRNVGSDAVLNAMLRLEPRLLVCGHIHACAGRRAQVGKTLIVNAGPGGVVVEIDPRQ